jgi:uncharacterized membrane protein (UPF0136 family)
MAFVTDLVSVLNTVLCVIIVILGILVYLRKGQMSALLIGIAFGLFAISHIYTLLGLASAWESAMITARTSGYILVIAALCLFMNSGGKKNAT